MKSRNVNKVILLGEVVRDPKVNKTGSGVGVCNFVVATSREWVTKEGERKSESMFHACVAWSKLAEICGELMKKGSLVYVEGSLDRYVVSPRTATQSEKDEVRVRVDNILFLT